MDKVAKRAGVEPSFGASPFALGRGEQFERTLLASGAERLIRELKRTELISASQDGFRDLRTKQNGGTDSSISSLDVAIDESLRFLASAATARGPAVRKLPCVVAALTVRIPRGVMLPEAVLIIDAVTVSHEESADGTRARLTVGEIKTYPDRGGETNRGQLAQARAQLGLYLHALEVVAEQSQLDLLLSQSGFLVMTRPGSDFPSVRTGEQLRYQADRAARGFDQLEAVALSMTSGTADPIEAVLHAKTHYSEACLEFCDLAARCHGIALRDRSPAVLGDAMVQFLGQTDLERALELLEGAPPLDSHETDMVDRLRAAEEPGWE